MNVKFHPYTLSSISKKLISQLPEEEIKDGKLIIPYTNSLHRELFSLFRPGKISECENTYLHEFMSVIFRSKFIEYKTTHKGYCYVHKKSHPKFSISIAIPLTELTDRILLAYSRKKSVYSEHIDIYFSISDMILSPVIPRVYMLCYGL